MRAIVYSSLLFIASSCSEPTVAPTGTVAAAQERPAAGACEACKPGADPAAAHADPRVDVARSDRIVMGSPRASHRVVVFTDPDCPYCAKLHATLEKLVRDRPDVRVELRLFPLPMHGESAEKAAKVALYAGRAGRGEAFLRTYFTTRGEPSARLEAAMADARVDALELGRVQQDRGIEADLAKDLADGRAAGVSGTPSLFVDGRRVVGARPIEDLLALLDP